MTPPVPDSFPAGFFAGTTLKVHRAFPDYPASGGWAYKVWFNGLDTFSAVGVAAADDGFDIAIAPTDTATKRASDYSFVERLTNAGTGEVYDVGEGMIRLSLNIAIAAAGATMTHEARTLAVIEAALEGRLSSDTQSYQIAGRAVVKIPITQLRKLYGEYKLAVARQSGKVFSRKVLVEFGNPSTGGDMGATAAFGFPFVQ